MTNELVQNIIDKIESKGIEDYNPTNVEVVIGWLLMKGKSMTDIEQLLNTYFVDFVTSDFGFNADGVRFIDELPYLRSRA